MKAILQRKIPALILFFLITATLHVTAAQNATILMQSDFDTGTYRITEPGTYKLGEDIIFHPNPENNFRPYNDFPGQPQFEAYPPQPFGFYSFGFFAGITIETCDVILNFNGHTFGQSKEFAYWQRDFFAVLLADDPFLPFPGTEPFNQLNSACNTTVKNGKIDRVTHVGVGGLGASDIVIKNMEITNFGVAGINMGGGEEITVKDVKISDTLQEGVGNGANVTSGRFAMLFLNISCQTLGPDFTITIADEPDPVKICDLRDELVHQLNLAERYVAQNDQSVTNDPSWPEAEETYIKAFDGVSTPVGSIGPAYGIFMQALKGRAEFQFPDDQPISANAIKIRNVKIQDLVVDPLEVIGIREASAGLLKNPGTDILRIQNISSDFNADLSAGANYYKGRTLENAILAVILTESFPGSTGGAVFTDEIVDWMTAKPAKTLAEALGANVHNYEVTCGTDGLGHAHKGLLGIRIDSSDDVTIKDVKVQNLENRADIGSTICGPYEGDNGLGFLGGDTRGIGLFSSTNVDVVDVEIEDIESTTSVLGIDLKNATGVKVKETEIEEIHSTATSSPGTFPNLTPYACGITGDINSDAIIRSTVEVEDFSALSPCPDEWVPIDQINETHAHSNLLSIQADVPDDFVVDQNYPNPFNPTTTIRFQLPTSEHVVVQVVDIMGSVVQTLVNEQRGAGTHEAVWNGNTSNGQGAASGMYFYRITAGEFSVVKKMILQK
ncbi:MAG: T9SS type A sorting domain-containing protein [Rhodothermaceae bacterium]|nr:T9SS type A sorting domain-containing protein [Rhodothermaceae bacterium]